MNSGWVWLKIVTQYFHPSTRSRFPAKKGAYMLEKLVLVCGIWSMVFLSMLLVQGIMSEVLTLGIWSKVLLISGFGPWY